MLTPVYSVPSPQLSCHPSQPITSLHPVLTLGSQDSFLLREASAKVQLIWADVHIDDKRLCLFKTETLSDSLLSTFPQIVPQPQLHSFRTTVVRTHQQLSPGMSTLSTVVGLLRSDNCLFKATDRCFRSLPSAPAGCWWNCRLIHFRFGRLLNPEVSTIVYCSELWSKLWEATPVLLRTSEELSEEQIKKVKDKRRRIEEGKFVFREGKSGLISHFCPDQ